MRHKNSQKAQNYYKTLGKIITKQRVNKNKSRRLLADEYGIGNSLFCRIEHGQNDPHLSSLLSISEALGVKLSVLIAAVEDDLPEDFTLLDW